MSRALTTVLALLLLAGSALPVAAAGDGVTTTLDGAYVPGEVIVRTRDVTDRRAIHARGLSVLSELGVAERGDPTLVSTGGRPVAEVIAELRADPSIETVEPNYLVELADGGAVAALAVNDPQAGDQYSLDRMRVRDAWSRSTGGSNVIAVLDTGAQSSHPDLAGRLVAGYDFVNDDASAADDNGHGTWVSGIIVARANDGYGVAGISWSDRVMPIKIMDGQGSGTTADLLAGITWAADHGADVINMSVGGFPYSQLVQDAVNHAWSSGAVLVGAAGNNRREETYYPASFDNVISVSATQVQDEFSNWSSWGPKVDVSAPGSSVLTTNCYTCTYADHDSWGPHTFISGTSFATPNVAGVVALIRARYPDKTPAEVVSRLIGTVDDLGYAGWDNRYGAGRVNAFRAVGGSVAASPRPSGDALEGNNSIGSARRVSINTSTRPSIYPAGDVDWLAVDVPRAGRLDVRVTGIADSRAYPWNRSPIPVDPIVELYTTSGTLLRRVDGTNETGIELAQWSVTGSTRILIKVWNWYANGNRGAYTVTPTFVDTVPPSAQITYPASGAIGVSRIVRPQIKFNEPVSGISPQSLVVRDLTTNAIVPAAVSYNTSSRVATITPQRLAAQRRYRVEATSMVRDQGGNALPAISLTFTTGAGSFIDTEGTIYEQPVEWLLVAEITSGCAAEYFCPSRGVTRAEMASFLSRALDLPPATRDHFTDDAGNPHQDAINRLADAGVTQGCTATRFCPTATITRAQMASLLSRALDLPPAPGDAFADDAQSGHEDSINRLAHAGIAAGCSATTFCPRAFVTRAQMAAFLFRAFADEP